MTQKSLHWDGASLGDADTLTVNAADGIGWRLGNTDYESPFVDLALRMVLNGTGNRGVLKGWANELACAGVATPVTVATGGAIVYGMPYENTLIPVNVVVPTPTNDTRYDYIVLRRDWTAQTIRITRIAGVEGGGIPALTQSPAPSGTGVYDVPLATLAIDIAGAITVTDAREWIEMTTIPQDDIFTTAYLTNESADWTARATRTKRLFLGGGDLEPTFDPSTFSYSSTGALSVNPAFAMTWGSAAVTEEGWITADESGLHCAFKMPADYAGGNVMTYVWWESDNVAGATGYYRTAYQYWTDGSAVTYSGTYTQTSLVNPSAQGVVSRIAGSTITGLTGDEMIYYGIYYNRISGDILTLGVEVEYTGYL